MLLAAATLRFNIFSAFKMEDFKMDKYTFITNFP